MSSLKRLVKRKFALKEDVPLELEGRTGNALGVVAVPGRTNMIYVTVGGSVLKVTNDLVPLQPGRPVLLVREKRGWRVKGSKASVSYTNPPGTAAHGNTHTWMGTDAIVVSIRQIAALRVTVVQGTMNIEVGRGVITIRGNTYLVDPTAAIDLTTHIPATAGKCRFVLVSISAAGAVTLTDGSEFDTADFALSYIPAAPDGHVRLAAVRLYYGQVEISENLYYTDIMDMRFMVLDNPITISDTGTINLTMTGATISGDVIPGGIKLDDLGAPDDNTDLNVSTVKHGLMPKLPGDHDKAYRGDGTFEQVSIAYNNPEDHSALCNGVKTEFTTTATFELGTTLVYLNGLLQRPGTHYTEAGDGTHIDFVTAPATGDELIILYSSFQINGISVAIPADIYVATTGSDTTGTGIAGAPFATVGKALSILPDVLTSSCTIHVADGTYNEGISIQRFRCKDTVLLKITGNTTTPGNVIFSNYIADTEDGDAAILVRGSIKVELEGISCNYASSFGIMAVHKAQLVIDRCSVSNATYAGIEVRKFSYCELKGNISVSGCPNGIEAGYDGVILQNGAGTVTIAGANQASSYGIHLFARGTYKATGASGLNITITDVKYGFQLGLHGLFQHVQATGTITIDNPSKPANSAAVQCTDLSSWSTTQHVVVDNFTYVFEGNSISYMEAAGTRSVTNVTGNTNLSQNSVGYLP